MSPRRQGIAFMLAFVALWAIVEALGGAVLFKYSPYQVVFTRYVVHLAFMFVVWGFREPISLWRTRRPAFQLARSLLMLVMPASFVLAVQHGVDGRTLMEIFWLSPLVVLALAGAFLREHAPWPIWAATLASAAAVLLMTGPGSWSPLKALVFPAGMALSFGAYIVMTRSLRSETTRANLFYTALGVALALGPFVPRFWVTPTPFDLGIMVAIGLLGFAGLFALDRAAEVAPLGAAMPWAYLQVPIFTAIDCGLGRGHAGKRLAVATAVIVAAGSYVWIREPEGVALEGARQVPDLP